MAESIRGLKRSHLVADITPQEEGKELTLMGWCHKQRDLGNLVFITLRDRSGELQLVIDDTADETTREKAAKVRSEYVLAVKGALRKRVSPNPDMPTGEWELSVNELRILSEAKTPPFYIEDGVDAREALRLEYRYLDLRRPEMQRKLIQRHQITKLTRDFFDREKFLEVETPMLIKSTPEGARDYLVPSRVFPGNFFALPQSPQLFKQLLMLSGYDRYMQIARCFRDEDLRADRQPEFTQIDLEMSFVSEDDVMSVVERYLAELFEQMKDHKLELPLRRLTWKEAMERFGSDKPDTRFGMELVDISDLAAETEFRVFSGAVKDGGKVALICVPGGADMKRREIDGLTDFAKTYGAKGLAWATSEAEPRGSFLKFVDSDWLRKVFDRADAGDNDLILIVADKPAVVYDALGHLRVEIAERRDMIPEDEWDLLWVTEFPMFEKDEENDRLVAMHHPFTSPMEEDVELLETDPEAVRARAYDIVLNGNEIGGGSIRIHDQAMQAKILKLIGFTEEESKERFGFLLDAFAYGVPPHGGLAFGLDRMVMLLTKSDSIRDVIAFPKVQNSSCLMTKAPGRVDDKQLEELGLSIEKVEEVEAPEEV